MFKCAFRYSVSTVAIVRLQKTEYIQCAVVQVRAQPPLSHSLNSRPLHGQSVVTVTLSACLLSICICI